jgi:hypothetical protein
LIFRYNINQQAGTATGPQKGVYKMAKEIFRYWLVIYDTDTHHQAIIDYLSREWNKDPVITLLYGTYSEIRNVLPGHRVRDAVGYIN